MALLFLVEAVAAGDVVVGSEQKSAGAAGRIDDDFAGARLDAIDDGVDQRAAIFRKRRKVSCSR